VEVNTGQCVNHSRTSDIYDLPPLLLRELGKPFGEAAPFHGGGVVAHSGTFLIKQLINQSILCLFCKNIDKCL